LANLRKVTIKIHDDVYTVIENMSKKSGDNVSETIRKLLVKSLSAEWFNENTDVMASLIRQQMDIVLKPHVERLAALESKAGHAAATSMFLNVQAFMDLLPAEKRKVPKEMYEKARKKAVEYMRTSLDQWSQEEI
jgi:hypothetical protein